MTRLFFFVCFVPMFFTLSSVAQASLSDPIKIDANPAQGFNWPYYLYVPTTVGPATTLLVEPNNTGYTSDNFADHDAAAQATAWGDMPFAADIGCPVLVPVFPRPSSDSQVYTHALDRATLLTNLPGLQRIDLQLIAMIDDARARLGTQGKTAGPKIFMMGFSAAGMFTNRFTLLHPDRVQAAAIGSPGGWPLAPVTAWQGQDLHYNIGISDVASLTGSAPDLAAFVAIPQYFYIGDQDTNDAVNAEDTVLINQMFGTTPVARWPKAQEIYASISANARFVLYPGVGHTQTSSIENDIKHFFLPGRAFSSPHIVANVIVSAPEGKFRFEWATLSGLGYHIQSSVDLVHWSEQGLPTFDGDGLGQNFETLTNSLPHLFRIKSIYTPASGSNGRFIVLFIGGVARPTTLSCVGLNSGTFTTSEGSTGTFAYGGQPAHGVFNVTNGGRLLPSGGQISGDFNVTTGMFVGQFLPSGGTGIPLQNPFEMLTVP